MSSPIDSSTLLDHLKWRYATKTFDASKTIPEATWKTLEETLVLTPSSYGLQPWKFVVITDGALKEKLRPHAWNQAQVTDCSHFVVFATKTTIDSKYIDDFIRHSVETRRLPAETLTRYRDMMVEDLVHGARSGVIAEWAARQAYIALGSFMTAAALLEVDACPMEGFAPAEFDKILELTAQGLTASVCCAAGYRSASDKYATAAKIRFAHEDVVVRR
jgi:nitroreductase